MSEGSTKKRRPPASKELPPGCEVLLSRAQICVALGLCKEADAA